MFYFKIIAVWSQLRGRFKTVAGSLVKEKYGFALDSQSSARNLATYTLLTNAKTLAYTCQVSDAHNNPYLNTNHQNYVGSYQPS